MSEVATHLLQKRIEQLIYERDLARAENEKLRAALKPFADAAEDLDEDDKDNRSIWEHWVGGCIEIGHLRAAAAALKETDR